MDRAHQIVKGHELTTVNVLAVETAARVDRVSVVNSMRYIVMMLAVRSDTRFAAVVTIDTRDPNERV